MIELIYDFGVLGLIVFLYRKAEKQSGQIESLQTQIESVQNYATTRINTLWSE